jgi:multicomponent Na+:H+ antiporter subunit E
MALVLSATWLLLSGHFGALLLGLGVVSCGLVLILSQRMAVIDRETQPLHLAGVLPRYWLWLLGQILRSNLDVVRRILSRRPDITPTMVRIAVNEKTELCQTIFANSITLTPGTVSVGLQDGTVEVHGLTRKGVKTLAGGEMQRRVLAMEKAVTDKTPGESEG